MFNWFTVHCCLKGLWTCDFNIFSHANAKFLCIYFSFGLIVFSFSFLVGFRVWLYHFTWTDVGLLEHDHSWDSLEIAMLACCCAVHKHGFDVLFSFSAMVQHTPNPPIGFSILKAGLNKSVLLSIYSSSTTRDCNDNRSHGICLCLPNVFCNDCLFWSLRLAKENGRRSKMIS